MRAGLVRYKVHFARSCRPLWFHCRAHLFDATGSGRARWGQSNDGRNGNASLSATSFFAGTHFARAKTEELEGKL